MTADPVRDTTNHQVCGYFDGVPTAPLSAIPGVIVPHDVIAMSQGDLTKTSLVTMDGGDARTLAWNPGFHRYNCAGWRMEVFRDDPDTAAIQLEYNGTRTWMQGWEIPGGNNPFLTNIQVISTDTIRFHAISGKIRSEQRCQQNPTDIRKEVIVKTARYFQSCQWPYRFLPAPVLLPIRKMTGLQKTSRFQPMI